MLHKLRLVALLLLLLICLSGNWFSAAAQRGAAEQLLLPASGPGSNAPTASAPGSAVYTVSATLERVTLTSQYDPPSPDPTGIAYLAPFDLFMISDSEVEQIPNLFRGVNLFSTTRTGELVATSSTLAFSSEPAGVAYDPLSRHLFFADDDSPSTVYELDPGGDQLYGTADDLVTSFRTGDFGGTDTEGIAVDTWRGHLFLADDAGQEVYDIDPGANHLFDGVPPAGDDLVTSFDTAAIDIPFPEGVQFSPDTGHLFILSQINQLIAETTLDGTVLRYIDISTAGILSAADLAYAPSSTTPGQSNLFVVDRGYDDFFVPGENDGKLFELAFPAWMSYTNEPPAVSAEADPWIILPVSATLYGTVTDDGLPNPPGAMAVLWSQVSGPGLVTFADVRAANTTATFSAAGAYVLRLSACDGDLAASAEMTILVLGENMQIGTLERRVSTWMDDVEENAGGVVSGDNPELHLVHNESDQTVGLRFSDIAIPQGAQVLSSYLQFQAAETGSETTTLVVQGEAADNSLLFHSTDWNVSSRPRTVGAAEWRPGPWLVEGEAGLDQRTADLSGVVQEIVSRPGWSEGNSLALVITGSGVRVAESYEGDAAGAPLLRVEYATHRVWRVMLPMVPVGGR